MNPSSLRRFVMLLVLALGTVVGSAASASHYRLPIAGLISEDETTLLRKAGIETTLGLLQEVKTPAQRKRVVALTGIAAERVDALARTVDLLRIEGVGPNMVRLLNAAGVRDSQALGAEIVAALHARMTTVNAASKIANVLPQPAQLAAWVAAAKRIGPGIEAPP